MRRWPAVDLASAEQSNTIHRDMQWKPQEFRLRGGGGDFSRFEILGDRYDAVRRTVT